MSQPKTDTSAFPLLRTKFHRPRMTDDLVMRPRLLERLDQRRQRPLTLVSAPAGYGKTMLVSSWLEASDWYSAWLSLDADDDDVCLFLAYLSSAIQTIFPEACADTQSLLKAPTQRPLSVLARTLINELDQIETPFILVLDDYHFIQNMDVHDLIDELLAHPPLPMHLVLISRIDPPLNLARYRARRQVTEIRTHDLRFTKTETAAFLKKELGTPAGDRTVISLLRRVEGWVTGMRLVTLSLRHRAAANLEQIRLQGGVTYITEYLIGEVLDSQPPPIQEYLLCTAILDRFCAPLCQVMFSSFAERSNGFTDTAAAETVESEMDGESFLEWLTTGNLFVISLDDQGYWYRYHHLFREILEDLLAKKLGSDGIAVLHKRASVWLAENCLVDEALHHALAAGDATGAEDLVVENRHELMNRERWQLMGRWLNLLRREAVEQKAELLLTKAWMLASKIRFEEIPPLLEQVADIIDGDYTVLTAKKRAILGGEMAALRSILFYWMGQGQLALDNAGHAVEVTPIEHEWVRSIGLTYQALALQEVGQLDKAREEIHKRLAESGGQSHRAYVTLMGIEMLAGNLSGAEQAAKQILDLTETRRFDDSVGWAQYTLGFVHYQRNDLVKAKVNFTHLVEMRYLVHAGAAAHGYYGLALTYQLLGEPDLAREVSEAALAWASETENAGMLLEAYSLASQLTLLQGQVPDTSQWAGLLGDAVTLTFLWHIPHLTLANVLMARGTPGDLQKAGDLLDRLSRSAESTHNTWRLMEITAMQALHKEAEAEPQVALNLLEQVVAQAEPLGYIRLFADLGPRMAGLLDRLRQQGVSPDYIARILAAFTLETKDERKTHVPALNAGETEALPSSTAHPPLSVLIEPLTNRELEVLELLAQELSNKEIAAQLVLTLGTVKQYSHSIYQKLDVKNRREAVRTASDLGILPSAAE